MDNANEEQYMNGNVKNAIIVWYDIRVQQSE